MPVLDVWWDRRNVGRLMQDRHGDLSFAYAPEWLDRKEAPPLSASLPKRPEPFSRRECRPFFGGLLPEQSQRRAAAGILGVSAGNDFALLDKLGGDVAGALQLLPEGERPADPSIGAPKVLDDDALVGVLDALPHRPLLAGEEGLRLSLAGAQSKLPVVLLERRVALPAAGQPTTWILKPPIDRFPSTTENEAFVMRLAGAIDLDVAPVEARVVGGRRFLMVMRYDRRADPEGHVHRLHQEDFCQALGVPPELKYASEGGPTLADCFALLRRMVDRPAADLLRLLDAVIFNLIVGNADAHGKNFSILYDDGIRLAPLYDLLATAAYPELSPKMAMRIGKRAMLGEMDDAAWSAFAAEAGLGLPLVRRRITEISDRIRDTATAVAGALAMPGLDEAALSHFVELVRERAERCPKTIGRNTARKPKRPH